MVDAQGRPLSGADIAIGERLYTPESGSDVHVYETPRDVDSGSREAVFLPVMAGLAVGSMIATCD